MAMPCAALMLSGTIWPYFISYTYFRGFFCLVTMASGSIIWSWRVPPFKVVYLFIHLCIIFLEHSHTNGCTILQYFIAILMGTPPSSILECILSRESSKYCAFEGPVLAPFGLISHFFLNHPWVLGLKNSTRIFKTLFACFPQWQFCWCTHLEPDVGVWQCLQRKGLNLGLQFQVFILIRVLEDPKGSGTKSGLGWWANSIFPETSTFCHKPPKCLQILSLNLDFESKSSVLNFWIYGCPIVFFLQGPIYKKSDSLFKCYKCPEMVRLTRQVLRLLLGISNFSLVMIYT